MAHLWIYADGGWAAAPLMGDCLEWVAGARARHELRARAGGGAGGPWIRQVPGDTAAWLLLAPPGAGVTVNGEPLRTGARVLADRDEIRVKGGRPVYFSIEELARVVAFPGLAQAALCPRCRRVIEPGQRAVRCPSCGYWHHQEEASPCWSYHETCTCCAQATGLDAGYRWTPEEE